MDKDLGELLAAWFDSETEPARQEMLLARLQADPAFRAAFVEEIDLLGRLKAVQASPARWLRLEEELRTADEPAPVSFTEKVMRRIAQEPTAAWPKKQARRWPRAGLAAAAVLLAVGFGLYLAFPTANASATPDVVDRLIDWNLEITQARSQEERKRIYADQVGKLKESLTRTELPPEEQELAKSLMETSSWLTENNDPMAEADRFNELTDKLVARVGRAKGEKRIVQLADTCQRVAELGMHANLERAVASGALDFEHRRKLERAVLRDANSAKKLEEILARNPEASRKVIRQALKLNVGKHKKASEEAK